MTWFLPRRALKSNRKKSCITVKCCSKRRTNASNCKRKCKQCKWKSTPWISSFIPIRRLQRTLRRLRRINPYWPKRRTAEQQPRLAWARKINRTSKVFWRRKRFEWPNWKARNRSWNSLQPNMKRASRNWISESHLLNRHWRPTLLLPLLPLRIHHHHHLRRIPQFKWTLIRILRAAALQKKTHSWKLKSKNQSNSDRLSKIISSKRSKPTRRNSMNSTPTSKSSKQNP